MIAWTSSVTYPGDVGGDPWQIGPSDDYNNNIHGDGVRGGCRRGGDGREKAEGFFSPGRVQYWKTTSDTPFDL